MAVYENVWIGIMKLSIIVPCYNEEESMPLFYEEINKISKENIEEV
mgnify:CR=1 FL=1